MTVYDLLIAETYTPKGGEEKTRFHRVGAAFASRNGDGFNIEIPPGIAISGKALLRPRKEKAEAAQPSAADEYEV